TKDDITLQGRPGALLVPPPDPKPCADDDPSSIEGICVRGTLGSGDGGPPTVVSYVHGDTVSGFRVRGFADSGIAVAGGDGVLVTDNALEKNAGEGVIVIISKGTQVSSNTAKDNGGYGIFSLASTSTQIAGNKVSGSG